MISLNSCPTQFDSPGVMEPQPSAAPATLGEGMLSGPMPKEQTKYAQAIIRTLKKKSEATPFLQPVDPVALGIPHYTQVITNPMDLGTIDRKLTNQEYNLVEDFINDVNQVWQNCYTFNGPESQFSGLAKTLSAVFDKQAMKLPTLQSVSSFVQC